MATPGESLFRLAGFLAEHQRGISAYHERASERTEQRRRYEARMEAERLRAAEVEARFQAQAQESARRFGLGQEALAFETKLAGMKEATPETAPSYVARLRQMGDPEAMAPGTTEPTVIPPVGEPTWTRTETYAPEPRVGPPTPEEMGPGLAGMGPEGRMAEVARRRAFAPMVRRPPEVVEEPNPLYEPARTEAPTQPLYLGFLASYAGRAKEAAQSREDVAATGFYKMLAKVDPAEAALVAGQHLGQEGETTAAPDVPEHVRRAQEAAAARAERERASKERQAGLRGRRGAGRARPIPDTRLRRYFREGNVAAISAAYRSGAIPEMAGRGDEGLAEYLQMGFEGAQAERSALASKWAGDRRVQGLSREIAQADKESRDLLIQSNPAKKAAADKKVRGLLRRLDELLEAQEAKAARGGYEPPEITDYPPQPAGEGYDEPEESGTPSALTVPPSPRTMGPGGWSVMGRGRPLSADQMAALAAVPPDRLGEALMAARDAGIDIPAGILTAPPAVQARLVRRLAAGR